MNAKKILVIGAFGNVGAAIVQELLAKGYAVTAASRHPATTADISSISLDASDAKAVATAAAGFDAVIASISGRASGHDTVPAIAQAVLDGLSSAGVARLLWVGGAGSLLVNGSSVADSPDFPAEWKPEAIGQAKALEVFKNNRQPNVKWTFFSPAALFTPGDKAGNYQVVAGDNLLADAKGNSAISFADFAEAMVAELAAPTALNQRITIAYK